MRSFGSRKLCIAMAVVSAMVISAYGSAAYGSSGGINIAALKAKVAPHTHPAAHVGPTVKITKPIPKGKSIVFINCGAPACTDQQDSFDAAAAYLKWHVTNLTTAPTPQGIQNAYAQAIRDKPAVVISTGFAISQFPEQAKELNKLKIPIFMGTGTDQSTFNPSKGIALQLQPPQDVEMAASLNADNALINGGAGTYAGVNLTGYPSVALQVNSFGKEIKKQCSTCKYVELSVTPQDLTTTAPTIVANFLRANPGLKGLYFGYSDIYVGVPQALKTAGIPIPKVYAWAPDSTAIQQLQDGQMTGATPLCYVETGWQFADGVARYLTGYPLQQSAPNPPYVIWAKQYHTVPSDVNDPPCIADYKQQFEALWH